MDKIIKDTRPFWEREDELLEERGRIANLCWTAKTLGELVATGVNAVRVYDADNNYLGYAYLERDGKPVYEDNEEFTVVLTADTPIKQTEIDRDDDGFTILITTLDEGKKND